MIKLLAIDDNKDNLVTITAILKYFLPECLVLSARSGEEGIATAISEQPDVILLDIIMPDMDGFETCHLLKNRDQTRDIPIIMITALKTDSASRARGLELGAEAFLSKPIDEVELTSQVKVALRMKKAEDSLRRKNEELEQRVAERTSELMRKNKELINENRERRAAETLLQASLEEKKILLKEVHHRVKNNMAIIYSFLELKARSLKDAYAQKILRSSRNRIKSMALVHEHLYKSENLKKIDVAEYLDRLISSLMTSFTPTGPPVCLELEIQSLQLEPDILVPLGMLVNEIVSNSLEHAFKEIDNPQLYLHLKKEPPGGFTIVLGDNGCGIPEAHSLEDSKTTGILLVGSLAKQLGGKLVLNRENGTVYNLFFPLD